MKIIKLYSLILGLFLAVNCHARQNQWPTFFNLEHRYLTTSKGSIALLDSKPQSAPTVPTLLLIHGHLTNKSFFDKQLNSPLFSDFRLIALDMPGYGESSPPNDPQNVYSLPGYADVVAEVVTQLGLENLVVMGWSLGGHVGLELTSRLPQMRGLLITGTPPIEISIEGFSKGFLVQNKTIANCFGRGDLSYEETELLATVSGYDYTLEKKYLVDAILESDEGAKTIYPQSLFKGVGLNELEIIRDWPKPIAVIAGANEIAVNNDYIINEVHFSNLWEEKVHVISDGGHLVFRESPDEFNAILLKFLQDCFYR